MLGGRKVHPTFGLPGGVSKAITEEERQQIEATAREEIEFALFSLQLFRDVVLKNKAYVDLILSDGFTMPTYYMGMVDENNKVNFYDGKVRVVDPEGKEFVKYTPERVPGRRRRARRAVDVPEVPLSQEGGLERVRDRQGQRRLPGHAAFAAQRRRRHGDAAGAGSLRRVLQDAGRQAGASHAGDPLGAPGRAALCRRAPAGAGHRSRDHQPQRAHHPHRKADEGVGIVEAPRGTLTHHYITDEKGIVKKANLIVGTTNNYAPISISIKKAAKALITKGTVVTEGLLNTVEMAFRSYDPCFGCATHTLPGQMPLEVRIFDADRNLKDVLKRNL